MKDASLSAIDLVAFMQVSAKKTCGAKIPLVAVCHRYQRIDST